MHGLNQLDVEGLMTIDDNTKAVIQILIGTAGGWLASWLTYRGKRGDNGEIIRLENGNVEFSEDTREEGIKEQEELFDEEISINLDEIKKKVKFLVTNLDQLDTKLSGYDAEIYDMLMDKLEEEI